MDVEEIIANAADGILVLGRTGTIEYFNEAFNSILESQLSTGDKYAQIMEGCPDERNDAFHQVILDSIRNQENLVHRQTCYYRNDGQKRFLRVSAKRCTDSTVLTITDITELVKAKIQHRDSALITAATVGYLSVWVYFTKIWPSFIDKNNAFPYMLTYIMLFLGGVVAVICLRYTSLSIANMGLNAPSRKTLLIDLAMSGAFIVIASIMKLVILQVNPGFFKSKSFLDWTIFTNVGIMLYPLSVLGQEILGRGFIQEAFRIVFQGKHEHLYSLLVSSLFFGALHIHKNFGYMIVTPIFMFVCGLIYEKQKSIWGICILHYILLITCKLLGMF